MKLFSVITATLLFGGSLAIAQVCPPTTGSTCLVPNPNIASTTGTTTYVQPYGSTSSTVVVPYSGMTTAAAPACGVTTGMYPVTTAMYPVTTMYPAPTGMYAMAPSCGTNISPDTTSIVTQISALRGDVRGIQGQIRAASLEVRGQQLLTRVNQLMADEMLFRQQLAANPNLPNAQVMASSLNAQADLLNRDLTAFNRELALIPADQRPYIASSLNAFTVAYWDPTMQRFADYRTQFAQTAPAAYQPAVAANPWLTNWQTGYQASLGNIAMAPQVYASANWWSSTQVLGSMESYPGGGTVMLPPGAVVYIPTGAISTMGVTGLTPMTPMTPGTVTTTTGTM